MKQLFLTALRDNETTTAEFRHAAHQLSLLLAAEAANLIPLASRSVHTPLGTSPGAILASRVVLVAILRAGLVLLPSFQKLFEDAPIGFFGVRRDEKTADPHLYYENLPTFSERDWIILLDPMLATGGTSCLALNRLRKAGASPSQTILVSIVAAQEGIEIVKKEFPSLNLITAAIDPALNTKKFIVPGLGDFGDRYFDTSR